MPEVTDYKVISDVANQINFNEGNVYEQAQSILQETQGIDFYENFQALSNDPRFSASFNSGGQSGLKSASEVQGLDFEQAVISLNLSEYATGYIFEVINLIPLEEEDIADDLELSDIYVRINNLTALMASDTMLSNEDKSTLSVIIQSYEDNLEGVFELVESEFGTDSISTSVLKSTNKISLKKTWRKVRSVVATTATFAGVGAAAGGPLGAIVGGVAGLVGSTLDVAINDRCHFAINCGTKVQDCSTGQCGQSSDSNGGYVSNGKLFK
ncbi:MAG: hypothetical protein HC896_04130 [Bacteroidales bacterium]|nr:hypothetical protein [Bacteroidales bacterium]